MTTPTAAPPPRVPGSTLPGAVETTLRAARIRLAIQHLLDALSVGAIAAAGLLAILIAAQLFRGAPGVRLAPYVVCAGALAVVLAFCVAAARWPTLRRTAALLDERARTHDRFHTALEFTARTDRSTFEDLTLEECAHFAGMFPVRRWTPLRVPRSLRFLAIPVVLGAGLIAFAYFHPYKAPAPTALDNAVARQADDLKSLAAKLQQKSPDTKTPDLDKLAEEMKNSARRLQDNAARPDEQKLKEALRELSSLEAMLQAMKQAAREQRYTPEEMAALTAALAANQQTQAAADALKSGDPAQAGAELEKLLQQLQQQGNDAAQTLQQLAQSMQEQAAKLTEQEKSEVAQQMQQAAQAAQSGQSQLSQQSLERLAQLLKRIGGNKSGGQSQQQQQQASGGKSGAGAPMTQQELDQLISQLENMKDHLQPGDDGKGSNGQGDPSQGKRSLAMVESFAKPGDDPRPGTDPSGRPGSEMDKGHSDKIFDDKTAAASPKSGAAKRLEGMPGEGESLQELVNAAGDASKAGRAYRQLYDAAAPAAQDAVEQENIPLGSRRFVRRYFENIRPQQ